MIRFVPLEDDLLYANPELLFRRLVPFDLDYLNPPSHREHHEQPNEENGHAS